MALLCGSASGASIEDVRKQWDPATGKAKDTSTTFSINGVVSARATLDEGKVLAFVQPVGAAGVPILVMGADAARMAPRNEVTLTGTLTDGPLGFAVLQVKEGSVTVGQTNKAFGAAEPCGADLFKDASSLDGRYVSLTNATFLSSKLDGSGKIQVKADAGEVTVLVSKTLRDRQVPSGAVNILGVPVKVNGKWCLLAARFLSVNNRNAQALAAKHTCLTCHNPDTKAVGPAYRDVAARYKDDPDAVKKMCDQMEKGGGGRWGTIPMPPLGARVPPADREQLAQWIYGYRWDALLAE